MSFILQGVIVVVLWFVWRMIRNMKNTNKAPPLAPGSWPVIGHMLKITKDPFNFFMNARKQCGPVYAFDMLWKRYVMVADSELFPQYFKAREDTLSGEQLAKDVFMDRLFYDSDAHYMQFDAELVRKLTRESYIDLVKKEVRSCFEELPQKGELDLEKFSMRLACNIGSMLLCGERLSDEVYKVVQDFEDAGGLFTFMATFFPSFISRYLLLPLVIKKRNNALVHVRKFVQHARANPQSQPDYMKRAFNMIDKGKPISDEGVAKITLSLLVAALTNTGRATANVLSFLADYPSTIKGLKIEQGDVLENPEVHKWIMECSRLSGGFTSSMRKTAKDIEMAGYTIPKGSRVYADRHSSFYQAALAFPPEKFLPERWASSEDQQQYTYTVLNWGAGVRACPGKAFSIAEMKYVLANAIEFLDIEPAKPETRYDMAANFHPQTTKMVRNYTKKK